MKGYIYEINIGDKKYVGSTKMTYLCNRQQKHNQELRENIKQIPLFEECRKQNITKIICELIEVVEVEDTKQLRSIEQSYMEKLKPELNLFKAIRTKEDERLDSIKRQEKYYNINKEKILEKKRERDKKKIICECGVSTNKNHLTRHLKSKKHLDYIKNK